MDLDEHKLPNVTFSYSNWYQCTIQCLKSLWFYWEITCTWFESKKVKAYFVGKEC